MFVVPLTFQRLGAKVSGKVGGVPLTSLTSLTFSEIHSLFNGLQTVESERQRFHPLTFAHLQTGGDYQSERGERKVSGKVSGVPYNKPFVISELVTKVSEVSGYRAFSRRNDLQG